MKETTTDGADRVGADRPNLFFSSSLIRKFQESTHKNQNLTNLHLKVTFLYTDITDFSVAAILRRNSLLF